MNYSIGIILILIILESGFKIKAAFLVAAFYDKLGWDALKDSFFSIRFLILNYDKSLNLKQFPSFIKIKIDS